MLAENKHEHGSSSKLNIASTLRVSVLYQVEPLISYPSAREGLHDRGTSGISVPPYTGHHTTISSPPPRGYTIAHPRPPPSRGSCVPWVSTWTHKRAPHVKETCEAESQAFIHMITAAQGPRALPQRTARHTACLQLDREREFLRV